jgi:hypothetical protein
MMLTMRSVNDAELDDLLMALSATCGAPGSDEQASTIRFIKMQYSHLIRQTLRKLGCVEIPVREANHGL